MRYDIISSIIASVIAIILFLIAISVILYEKQKKSAALNKKADEDWLFSNFQRSIYNLFFKKSSSESLCGISRSEYKRYCRILHEPEQYENIIALRIEAVAISFIFLVLAYSLSFYSIIIEVICFLIALTIFYIMWALPYNKLKSKADEKLFKIQDDLPRFLSLLEKAMDLPIDRAMLVTASHFQAPLSEDLIDSINKVSLGANGWTETLVDLARTYKIEDFSDLILEIVNSYEQGVNVRELVNRKATDVEQTRLFAVEAHDSKIKTLIFLPIIALKIVPLMLLICLPMIGDFI